MDVNKKHKIAQIKNYKQSIQNDENDISLTAILSSEPCQHILEECREFRNRVYTPMNTVFTFLKQVMNPDKSCKKAVAGVVVERLTAGVLAVFFIQTHNKSWHCGFNQTQD